MINADLVPELQIWSLSYIDFETPDMHLSLDKLTRSKMLKRLEEFKVPNRKIHFWIFKIQMKPVFSAHSQNIIARLEVLEKIAFFATASLLSSFVLYVKATCVCIVKVDESGFIHGSSALIANS